MHFIHFLILFTFVNHFKVWSITTNRWKLTYYPFESVSWYDGVRWCSNNSAHLLTLDVEKYNAVLHFISNQWQNEWQNNPVWIGLFLHSGEYKWQANCIEMSTSTDWSNWKNGEDFFKKTNKPCTVADDPVLEWRSMQCDKKYYQICEEKIGTCTFEDVTETGKCAKDMSSNGLAAATSTGCQQKCLTLEEAGKSCWSVTFDLDNKTCYPSFSNDPFAFETLTSCSMNANVSIRRCFEESINRDPFPFEEQQTTGSFPCTSVTDTAVLETTTTDMTTVLDTTTHHVTTVLHSITNHVTTVLHTTNHLTIASDDTPNTTVITNYQTEQTTNSVLDTSTNIDCCYCSKQYNLTQKELEDRIEHIKNLLKVDKRSTSKARRKRECAEDNRPTSRAIGWSGALLIAVVPLIFVIADASYLKMILESKYCRRSKTNYRRRRSYVTS